MQFKKDKFKVLRSSENNQQSKKKIEKQLLCSRFCKSINWAEGECESPMSFCGKEQEYTKTIVTFKTWETISQFCPVLLNYIAFGLLQFMECGKQLKKS